VQLALHGICLVNHAVMSHMCGMYKSRCRGKISCHPCVGSRLHCTTAARLCCCLHGVICMESFAWSHLHGVICMECKPSPALGMGSLMKAKPAFATLGCASYPPIHAIAGLAEICMAAIVV